MESFWDWVRDNAWSVWLVLGILLGIVETTTLDLVFLMLAIGAGSGAVASLAGVNFIPSALVAIGVSVAMLGVVRPIAKRHLRMPKEMRTGADALVGKRAVVTTRVDAQSGLVKLEGDVWTARPYLEESVIEPGIEVDVVEIRGATAMVVDPRQP